VLGLVKVFGGVLILGRVTAADVTADETFPQVDPGIAHLKALLAAFSTRLYLANFFNVRAGWLCVWHAFSSPMDFVQAARARTPAPTLVALLFQKLFHF
jgi:hypothetical protein